MILLSIILNVALVAFSVFYYTYISHTLPNIAYIGITIISILKCFEVNHLTVIVNRIGLRYWKDNFKTDNFNRSLKKTRNYELTISILLISMISLLIIKENIISNFYIDISVIYIFGLLVFSYCGLHLHTKSIYEWLINDLDI